MNTLLTRFIMFRRQVATLWHAFKHPATPFHLKAAMVAVLVYLISPIDLIPDFFLGLGMIDDILLVAFAVNWICAQLPPEVVGSQNRDQTRDRANDNRTSPLREQRASRPNHAGPTINGSARRV